MIASALGCSPSPNSAAIWDSLTSAPSLICQSSSTAAGEIERLPVWLSEASPEPTQRPGDSPLAE